MDIFLIFFTSLFVGLSGAVMPGPLLSVNIYGTLRAGVKGGLLTIVGHSLIEIPVIIFLFIEPKQFLSYQGVIGMFGGCILIGMGIIMLRSAKRINLEFETTTSSKNKHYVLHGILASISNPYWYLWWATIGFSSYFNISEQTGIYEPRVFYLGHISADFVWYGLITLLIAKGVRRINQKSYRLIILILGIFLTLLGAYFVYFGINKMRALKNLSTLSS